jgi:O-antigen/teichoic acid export membrane protein
LATSVADQGLVSSTNFVLNVLLVRWLSPAEYGAFAIGFAALLFVSSLHTALLNEPMNVLGPQLFRHDLSRYLGHLVAFSGGSGLVLALLLWGAETRVSGQSAALGSALLGLCLSLPVFNLASLLRQACYLETRPQLALRGSAAYAVALLALLASARASAAPLTPFGAFAAMAGASAVAALVFARAVSPRLPSPFRRDPTGAARRIAAEHWAYGRFMVAAGLAHSVGYLVYLPLVGVVLGLAQSGILRAVQNLVLPLQQVLAAFGLVLVPWVSRQRALRGDAYLAEARWKTLSLNVGTAAGYGLVVVLLGRFLLDLLYGGGRYSAYAWALPILAAGSVFTAVAESFGVLARARRRPDIFVWSKIAPALVMLAVGLPAVRHLGLLGAFAGLALAALCEAAVIAILAGR